MKSYIAKKSLLEKGLGCRLVTHYWYRPGWSIPSIGYEKSGIFGISYILISTVLGKLIPILNYWC
jgi:hypothetical protein